MSQNQEYANAVKETALGMQRRKDATAFIKDIRENAKQKGIDTKNLGKHAKLYLEQNAAEIKAQTEELFCQYESLPL